jgi:NYN domain
MDFKTSPESSLQASAYTGAILLDVENFPLKFDLAQHLKPYCRYPITVKFAVANWLNNSVSKLDQYLHQQGYQLIHVPKSKNAADAQILTLGASLQWNYPQVKEVVIVSHDAIFNYLHQTLQRQGQNTYRVYQHSGNVYLDDFVSDRNSIITKIPDDLAPQTISLEQKIQTQIELTLTKLIQKSPQKVTLSQLSQEFKVKHQKSISEILQSNKLPKSTLSFIQKNCAAKIKVEAKDNEHYLSLTS